MRKTIFKLIALAIFLTASSAQATIVIYNQNFENPVGFVEGQYTDVSQQLVNDLYGGQPPGFNFDQAWTVETLNISGGEAFGTGYSDPSAIGGNYALGMLSTIQNDLLGLSFNIGDYDFLNVSLTISSIGLDGPSGPFVAPGDIPVFKFTLYDNPDGTSGLGIDGNELSSLQATGTASAQSVFDWTPILLPLNATGNTNGNVILRIDLLDGGYAAMDNFLITASNTNDLGYTPVTPCRIVDTRNSGGIINATTLRNFHVFGSGVTIGAQGGNPYGCPSPLGEPLAAHINVVAVDPTGKGNLQAFPLGAGPGAGLIVNYNAIDTNLANAGTVKSITGGGPDITVTSRVSSVHAVIDVLGYYYPAGDLTYTPVTPCRIVDTRNAGGIINATAERDFYVYGPGSVIGPQGGKSAGCPSPGGEPYAAHINVVAVDPTGKGNLQAYPLGAGSGAGLIVNYNAIDTNLANAGTVKSVTGGGPDITVSSRVSSVHAVIDVLGYYYPAGDLMYTPVAPCRIVDTRNTSAGIIAASTQRDFNVFGSGGTISSQGGTSAGCPSPLGEPLAAHINLVAVDPTGKGNLQAFPLGAGPGAGLIVNYNAIDTNLANAGTVKSVAGGGPDITVTSRVSSVHAVIDVLGYYYPAP
jgi:hypothetical protein